MSVSVSTTSSSGAVMTVTAGIGGGSHATPTIGSESVGSRVERPRKGSRIGSGLARLTARLSTASTVPVPPVRDEEDGSDGSDGAEK